MKFGVPGEAILGADNIGWVAVVGVDLLAGLDGLDRDNAGDHAEPGVVDCAVDGVGLKGMINLFWNWIIFKISKHFL